MTTVHAKALIGLCIDEGLKQGVLKNRGEFEELLDYLDKYFTGTDKMTNGSSETPSNLEEAANNYLDGVYGKMPHSDYHIAIFIAGAKWQKEQMKETHCLRSEKWKEVEETARHEYENGWKDSKEQMMKEAVECTVTTNLANRPVIYLDQLKGFQYGDKVHIIIVKED